MARKSKEEELDGTIKVELPPKLVELLREVAVVMDASPRWVFQTLLRRIENMAVLGEVDSLGFEFAQALKRLNGRGRMFDEVPSDIDLTKLHRSDKAKSGFVGVYSNGKGFRAEGRDPGSKGLITLGTFPTAEGAALARFTHYKRHGLPYGRLEDTIEKMKLQDEVVRWSGGNETKIKHLAIWEAKHMMHQPFEGLTEEERDMENVEPISGVRGGR
jgi:hypothetical protein